jgi:regulator of RNase E activity RraA
MSIADRLKPIYSGAVYDVLRAMGHTDCVLPSSLRPLDSDRRLTGEIFTVSGRRDQSLDAHETLLKWTELLSKAPADTVVMCQPNDHTMAHMGELSAETMVARGVRGYIVDGGCRDTEFIKRIGFQVFCRYFTPRDVVGRWVAHGFGEPVTIGDVQVHTGDFVVADRDGVVVIPKSIAAEVVDQAEEVLRTESLVRKAILEGKDPKKAYLKYGKF